MRGLSTAHALAVLVFEALVVEDQLASTAAWVHSILHFLVAAHVVNFLNQNFKTVPHIGVCKRTCLDKKQVMHAGELLCFARAHLALTGVSLTNV